MALEETFISILIILLVIIISALPLHLAVSFLGGRSSILKSFLVMIVTGILSVLVNLMFPIWGTIIAWFLLIWIFHEVFRLRWLKTILAWILWIGFVLLFTFMFALFGLANFLVFGF